MQNKLYKQIFKKIKEYNTIVIARHIGADPDSLGSQIGLKDLIINAFPDKKVYAIGLGAAKFKYIGNLDKMSEDYYKDSLLIVLDTPDTKRVDGVDISKFGYSIKIDHHPEVEKFCDLEWIDDTASSVCQMIIELSFNSKLKMTKEAAEKLFIGLVADTNRFLFYYTSVKTFELVKQLIEATNIDITSLYEQLYMRSLNEIRLEGYISQNMIITENGVAHILLKNDLIKEYNVDAASAGNLINNFNYIKGVLVWVMISEDIKQNIIRVNIRSRGPIINKIAETYGGGGHKWASGIKFANNDKIEDLIIELDNECKKYQENEQ
ncbi:MAG: bifunctional oligoribonuclease/PAP phosphatase NrnA [Bacilli bacterium]|nr:bifunctional oligoribonuclease/PAP phosphatase NrnA [Bacilli bacterium]